MSSSAPNHRPNVRRQHFKSGRSSGTPRPRRSLNLERLDERVVFAVTPHLVADINANSLPSYPSQMAQLDSTIYFNADDGVHGQELWKTDGTAAGTALVADINSGKNSANPSVLTKLGHNLFYTADDGTHGYELWKTDGTAAGTSLVKDIFPGKTGSIPDHFVELNGSLLFTADDGAGGSELWKTDGTSGGTVKVAGLNGPSYVITKTVFNGFAYFAARDTNRGVELWRSDGTNAGTTLVKDLAPGAQDSFPSEMTDVNGTLYFTADDGSGTRKLWKSDGTANGTSIVKDGFVGWLGNLTNVNGKLYFAAGNGTDGVELWRSDGTSAGTTMVKDIFPGFSYDLYVGVGPNNSNPRELTVVNGTLFFTATNTDYNLWLWKSDGTEAGTVPLTTINPTAVYTGPAYLTNVNGTLYFNGNNGGSFGTELWKSDGTVAGTVQVKNIRPANGSSDPSLLTNLNGTLFFRADDGSHGVELWRSDGTDAGTMLVKDVNATTYGSSPRELTAVNGSVYFAADGHQRHGDIWKSDGTEAGTVRVGGGNAENLVGVNGRLFFTSGFDLMKSDGTPAGTQSIGSFGSAIWPSSPHSLTDVNGTLYFVPNDKDTGQELWRSDGSVAGTTLVKDLYTGSYQGYYGHYYPNSSSPRDLTNVNGTLFFTATDSSRGSGLWKTDGTPGGTVPLPALNARNLVNINGTLFFSAYDSTNGSELWKSDGTAAGTKLVKDIRSGSGSSDPANLTNANGFVYFTADDGKNGRELWKSDGTAAGTVLVKDIDAGAEWSMTPASEMLFLNGMLYFAARNGTSGTELWRTDGTPAGTYLVKDIAQGEASSAPAHLTSIGNKLYFTADDGTGTRRLWQTDATSGGTIPITAFYVDSLAAAGDSVFFSGDDGLHGMELWTIVDDGAPQPPTISISDTTVVEGHTGTRSATFTVSLSAPSTQTVTVNYSTADGTAIAPADYTAAASTMIQFLPGETSKSVVILVQGDRVGESDEQFYVNLTGASNAVVFDGQGTGSIVDDEPRVSVGNVTQKEGNSGTTAFVFTVTLSAPYDVPVTVSFATANGTATVSDGDYTAKSGSITFAPGQTKQTIKVSVKGDRKKESNETFVVNLSGAANAQFVNDQAIGTILNDDRVLRGRFRTLIKSLCRVGNR
ncbi:MAG: ELWxxDGT repeat protein [Pirellulales bacterium]